MELVNEWEVAEFVPLPATEEFKQYAWGHAFIFADKDHRLDTDGAAAYAEHYMESVKELEHNTFLWPGHDKVFPGWVATYLERIGY